jgi:hypothetical protein
LSVELRPDRLLAIPTAAACPFGIFDRALLEEIGALDAVENFDEPWRRMRLSLLVAVRSK